jgi:hypothetical protein
MAAIWSARDWNGALTPLNARFFLQFPASAYQFAMFASGLLIALSRLFFGLFAWEFSMSSLFPYALNLSEKSFTIFSLRAPNNA